MTYADMLRQEGEQRALQRLEKRVHDAFVTSLTALLQARFGPLPTWVSARLESLDEKTILRLIPQAANAPSLEALLGSVPSPAPSAT